MSDQLENLGETVFLPQYRSKRRWSDRYKDVLLPLFPGYTFCRTVGQEHWRLLQLPSIRGVVGFSRRPAPVADEEVAALQAIASSGLAALPWPSLQRGDRVRLTAGPLRGLDGEVVSVRGTHRFVVTVGILQRSVAVEIVRDWLAPVEPRFYRKRLQRVSEHANVASRGL